MTQLLALISSFRSEDEGQGLAEYALILALIAIVAIIALIFLGGQVYEFNHFYHEGMALQTNLFSETFYTLVGFHGAHVTIGVLWLLALAAASVRGWIPAKRSLAVELAALYWHFVDIVWVVIFTLVYLMKAVANA